jgi:hypothetical protein
MFYMKQKIIWISNRGKMKCYKVTYLLISSLVQVIGYELWSLFWSELLSDFYCGLLREDCGKVAGR